ncbi:hypothetical protein CK203_030828 [Vitis vinifera]|uniref:Uncharacterized protein n=1 Tax=Vitis vinifera TaxID=29760 RepID=A0A438ID13_VITVI|nr:hypothetical protein CK203_030828 [Vitis vinifera]
MSANKEAVSSVPTGDVHEKPADKLSVKEFRDRFCIPNGMLVEFLDEEEVVSTEKAEGRAITFSKEQFNAGLRFPLPALFKEFLHFSQIPPAFIHPNIVRVLMGCSIINMLFNLDLSLLELPDSTKGGAKGYVVVRGPDRRGHVVEWVEKTSFVRLNKLFEITAAERQQVTLLTARNLMAVVRESQEYIINILPRKLPKKVVPGEHYILKDLPFYKEVQETDAQKRRARLNDREGRRKEGTLRKAPGKKRSASSAPAGAPAKKKRKVSKKGKEVKEPTPPKEFVPPPITYEAEGPALKRSRSARNLKSGLIGRLQDRFQETIEVSCSSVQDDHPEGSETEMTTEIPTVPVVIPDEGAPGETHPAENVEAPNPKGESLSNASSERNPVDDAACTSASLFSYAELEEKLKQIPPGSTVVMPSAKMFEVVEMLVSGLCGMAQQHDLFTNLLRTTDYMKVFASQGKNSEDQLHLRLEEAEASLSTAREDNEALRADLAEAKSREESMDARLHEAEDELRLSAQKEELEGEFAAEKEELEADYQKQVDDMFFFGYRYCMKKNGIKRDVPSIPPGEKKKLLDKPAP